MNNVNRANMVSGVNRWVISSDKLRHPYSFFTVLLITIGFWFVKFPIIWFQFR